MLRTPAFLLVRATTHRVQGRSYDTSPTRLATAFPSFARWCPTSSDSPGVPLLGILFALAIAMRVGCGVLTLRHAAFSGNPLVSGRNPPGPSAPTSMPSVEVSCQGDP